MKRVLLHGYTMENLGDDLFFRTITHRFPDTHFVLPTLNTNYRKKFRDIHNLEVVDFWSIGKLTTHKTYVLPKVYSYFKMQSFDAVVCIGGSLFIDRMNPTKRDRIEAEKYSFICDWEMAQKAKVPYFILGANWGPCYNQYFFDYFNRAFDSMKDIYFRDRFSYNIFKSKANVRYGDDILLGEELITDVASGVAKKHSVAISVIDASKKSFIDSTEYETKIANICDEFAATGYSISLLSFCSFEGDEKAIGRIIDRIKARGSVQVFCYTGNWKEMIQELAASEMIIASRFHATILGWTVGVPVYSIIYSDKTKHYLDDSGEMNSFCWVYETGDETGIDSFNSGSILSRASLPDIRNMRVGSNTAFDRLKILLFD